MARANTTQKIEDGELSVSAFADSLSVTVSTTGTVMIHRLGSDTAMFLKTPEEVSVVQDMLRAAQRYMRARGRL